ncbi:MAG: hypothetical protein NT024_15065 [Proteobacteria bacterium]|nr:hypothetical protein [Pseudomonadota bacterium]
MSDAPDRLAPWMAQGERPRMARACPAHPTSVTRPVEVTPPARNAQAVLKRYRSA